ncbi:HAD-IIIC family phosphatase [Enterovibrio sp. ZSDZ35]|uniref:HAD-IIIC family phosphatase n=1 Tax=Enterovibrio qingdaonensis TaxID=2899818 RepID=A0ABT5QN87_9GAMM|nr:HAD-IIIC family phosphatase [Enterovibrio sp. ZSDZ35]MDD1782451.1 HAD-IIIC family phosphatase [Enterovibrio sp. ZSDZ35]
MKQIKLIVWDLDETFWDGTLSEEGITIDSQKVELVKELTNRGIINSISSKNDFDKVKFELEKIGIWNYFVFPKIGWYSKGNAIDETVKQMGLRAENVLFIDDNHLNLTEVEKVVKGINCIHPKMLKDLSLMFDVEGKNDVSHSRLKQYQLIEEKCTQRKHYETDIEFLRSCNIKILVEKVSITDIERIHELINRTNQLNFTKKRISYSDLQELVKKCDSYKVSALDDYGDYGVVGFYSLSENRRKLDHFLFSCRTINLGIEQFLYNKLGEPELELVGEVAVNLESDFKPDWIKVIDNPIVDTEKKEKNGNRLNKILFKGGCDLSQMNFYLNSDNNIHEETNFVTESNLSIHSEHTSILLGKTDFSPEFPYLPKESFETKFFDPDFDYIVYSVLMDYTQDIYVNTNGDIIPFGGYGKKIELVDKEHFVQEKMSKFYKEYENIGHIKVEDFMSNLNEILCRIPSGVKIILINGAEVEPSKSYEKGCVERHVLFNKAVDEFCEKNKDRVKLLDVRKYVKNQDDLTDNIRHYKRNIYKQLADELAVIINVSTKNGNTNLIYYKEKIKNKIFSFFG